MLKTLHHHLDFWESGISSEKFTQVLFNQEESSIKYSMHQTQNSLMHIFYNLKCIQNGIKPKLKILKTTVYKTNWKILKTT